MSEGERYVSVIVVPDGGDHASRTFRIAYRRLRMLAVAAGALGLLALLVVGSWWYLAARALRTSALEEEVARLEADSARVAALAARLSEIESRYVALRAMFGVDSLAVPSELWLPPPAAGRVVVETPDEESHLPTSWPLTQKGFITRSLMEGATGEHPGLDIAVPTDSYVRASGAGTVVDAGEDTVYGRYVVVDHGNGYRTRYAHASRTLVTPGQEVRRDQVIALSGSTGRSTAPHLHFEILLHGDAVDPLSMVRRP